MTNALPTWDEDFDALPPAAPAGSDPDALRWFPASDEDPE
jgi:hypothetical protein